MYKFPKIFWVQGNQVPYLDPPAAILFVIISTLYYANHTFNFYVTTLRPVSDGSSQLAVQIITLKSTILHKNAIKCSVFSENFQVGKSGSLPLYLFIYITFVHKFV